MKVLNRTTLHKLLLNLLERPTTTLTFKTKKGDLAGSVYYDPDILPSKIKIEVDANNGDHILYVVHELLHVALSSLFFARIGEDLEEALLLGAEQMIVSYIRKSPARTKKWDDLINKKLGEHKDDVAYETLVDRPGEAK